jgi:exonuclease III
MNIDIRKFLHERDIEAGAVKLSVNSLNICILSIYRAASGNYALFLDKVEMIPNQIHNNNTPLIICGDININHLDENNNNKKKHFGLFTGLL